MFNRITKVVLLAVSLSMVVTISQANSNQMQIIVSGPDAEGITSVGICFTNPSELNGWVTYNIAGSSSGGFLKHSGTPACPSYASGSSGYRLTPGTTLNYTATASNNGNNFTASTTYLVPASTATPTPTPTRSETSTATPTPTPMRSETSTATPSPTPTPKSTSSADSVEDEGYEEDPTATLGVTRQSNGKYKLLIISNVAEDRLVITATRKGFRSITYRVNTNDSGDASIITSRNLSGFTLTLRYNGEYLDKVKAR